MVFHFLLRLKRYVRVHFKLSDPKLQRMTVTFEKGYHIMSNSEKQYRSEAFAAIHGTMEALHEVGTINKTTMRRFDRTCLTPAECCR